MIIKSIAETDTEILKSILTLYVKQDAFDLDPTYSKGNFYKEILKPKYRFDLYPQTLDCKKADCRELPLEDKSVSSIVFDPPFLFRDRPSVNNDINCKRFSYFKSWQELLDMYKTSIWEFDRLLKKGGYLIFKCQDMSDNLFYPTHFKVFDLASEADFMMVDFFILIKKNRIYHSECKQRVARKFHSYYFVFKKQ